MALSQAAETVTIALSGDHDLATSDTLSAQLLPAETAKIAIIDLSDVTFLDSTGLKLLLALQERMAIRSGSADLRIAGASPQIKRVLSVTGLDKVFSMFSTVDEAKAASAVGTHTGVT